LRFDQTYISIRKRSALEIMDLGLHVIRDYWLPLLVLLFVGAVPFALFNHWVIGWMSHEENADPFLGMYVLNMALLVANQSQVGTMLITHYVGQALFVGRPSIWRTIQSVVSASPGLFWLHGVLRMVLIVLLYGMGILREVPPRMDILIGPMVFLFLLVAVGLLVRAFRPFASEILLLEKTPLRANGNKQISYSRRSRSLHAPASSELFGRFLLQSGFACLLLLTIYLSLVSVDSIFSIHSGEGAPQVRFYWPLSLWVVAGMMAVVRFLSYIDIRIRQEGWAVELRMRAEAVRLMQATK